MKGAHIGCIRNSAMLPWFWFAAAIALLYWLIRKTRKPALSTLIVYGLLIFGSTVIWRSTGESWQYNLIPFRFLMSGSDHQWQAISNVLMFAPIGLLMHLTRIRWPILWSAVFSILIEGSQLLFRKGMFETDDIICNTVGAVIGYLLYRMIQYLRRKGVFESVQIQIVKLLIAIWRRLSGRKE